MIHQGGNTAETHTINLGKTSGKVVLTIDTFDIPDDVTVIYEDQSIIETGCLKTKDFGPGCNLNGACCDGAGVCTISFQYSGSSTQMTVHVMPNCSGTDETGWEFELSCPQ